MGSAREAGEEGPGTEAGPGQPAALVVRGWSQFRACSRVPSWGVTREHFVLGAPRQGAWS